MKIDARECTILDLFQSRNEVYYIPVYQRRYEWGKDQWEALWEDIDELDIDEQHFLGSIVVVPPSNLKKDFTYFEIVDGQQRVTTLFLFLIAIRNRYKELNEVVDYIDKDLLYSSYMRTISIKLKMGRLDKENLENLINDKIEKVNLKSNIYRGYEFFKNKLNQMEVKSIDCLTDKILKNIHVVHICANSHKDAFRLFETLNNRGLELSSIDLIKNYLLSKCATISEVELNVTIDIWDELMRYIDDIDKIRFFRQYLLCREGRYFPETKLYERYKELIDKQESMEILVEDILAKAKIYLAICKVEYGIESVDRYLNNLVNIGASTSYTFLLKVFSEEGISDIDKIDIIKMIEVFAIRRGICGWSTNTIDRIYTNLTTVNLAEKDYKDKVKEILRNEAPLDSEFGEKFRLNSFRQSNQTKYILEQLEYYLTKDTGEKTVRNRSNVHIEHIMPQTITTKSSKNQFGDWQVYLGEDAAKHKEYVNRIGNLTLLGAALNIKVSNNPFEAKKLYYRKSDMYMTRELCNYDEWKIATIEKRSNRLAILALKIWS